MQRSELKKRLWRIIADEGIIVTNDNIDWLLERVYKEHKAERNEEKALENAFQILTNALNIVMKEVAKTKVMCNLIIQMNSAILENQYMVYEANKDQAKKSCKELEEMIERTASQIETAFDEMPKPKKSCFDEFIKQQEKIYAKHVKENNIGE